MHWTGCLCVHPPKPLLYWSSFWFNHSLQSYWEPPLHQLKEALINLKQSSAVQQDFIYILQHNVRFTEGSQSINRISLLIGISQERLLLLQVLKIHQNTVKIITGKWRKSVTTVTLRGTRWKLVREAAERPALMEQQKVWLVFHVCQG